MNIVSCDEKTACGIANKLGWEYSEFENLGPEPWTPLTEAEFKIWKGFHTKNL